MTVLGAYENFPDDPLSNFAGLLPTGPSSFIQQLLPSFTTVEICVEIIVRRTVYLSSMPFEARLSHFIDLSSGERGGVLVATDGYLGVAWTGTFTSSILGPGASYVNLGPSMAL